MYSKNTRSQHSCKLSIFPARKHLAALSVLFMLMLNAVHVVAATKADDVIEEATSLEASNNTSPSDKAEQLEVLGLKSTERFSNFEVDQHSHIGSTQSISRQDFENHFVMADQLLTYAPSVQLRSRGGYGSNSEITLRGSSSKQVNYFLDGLLLNSPFDNSGNLQLLPISIIESIDVYSSFTPIELSSSNLAGAINLNSRRLFDESGTQASISHGSFNTQEAQLSHWRQIYGWNTIASAHSLKSDNDFPVEEDAFATNSQKRLNNAIKASSIFVKMARDFNHSKWQFLIVNQNNKKAIPSDRNRLVDNAELERLNRQIQAISQYKLGQWQLSHRLSATQADAQFKDSNATIGLTADKIKTKQRGYGAFNIAKKQLSPKQNLSFALNYRYDTVYQTEVFNHELLADISRHNTTLSASYTLQATKHWRINSVVRRNTIDDKVKQFHISDTPEGRTHSTAFHISNLYQFNPAFQIFINVGKTARMPTMLEKYGNTGEYIGNNKLVHEQASIVDTGFIWQFANAQLNSSIFYKDIKNGIYTIYDSRGVGRPENIGKSTILGTEHELKVQFNKVWSSRFFLSLFDSENLSRVKSAQGKQLPTTYHQKYGLSSSLNFEHTLVNLSYRIQDDYFYDPANTVEAEAAKQVDASISYFVEPLTVSFSANNITDNKNSGYNQLPAMGRAYHAKLSVNF